MLLISGESLPADLSTARVWLQSCLKVLVTHCCIAVCLGLDDMGGGWEWLSLNNSGFQLWHLPLSLDLPLILKINISGSPESRFRISHCDAWWGLVQTPSSVYRMSQFKPIVLFYVTFDLKQASCSAHKHFLDRYWSHVSRRSASGAQPEYICTFVRSPSIEDLLTLWFT